VAWRSAQRFRAAADVDQWDILMVMQNHVMTDGVIAITDMAGHRSAIIGDRRNRNATL
jgi:hypothetical protein